MPQQYQPTYMVWVDDAIRRRDENYTYKLGDFPTCEQAISACKSFVDNFLLAHHKPGMTANQLYDYYLANAEDPYISSTGVTCRFSAEEYAKQRCSELA